MALKLWGLATAGVLVIGTALLHSSARTVEAAPSPPEPCGTLDLSNPLTQHCKEFALPHHLSLLRVRMSLPLPADFAPPVNIKLSVPDVQDTAAQASLLMVRSRVQHVL